MDSALVTITALALLLSAAPRSSSTLPGPKENASGICASYQGLAFTFCVALCETRVCERPRAEERCAVLRRGFRRVSGGARLPCPDRATERSSSRR